MNFFKKVKSAGYDFNDNQKKAITHTKGPLLVVAGPGSGKTSVITARTAHLVQEAGINPANILVITFTRAAANEMKTRYRDFPGSTPEHIKKIDFGTFHSTFYKIINNYYGRSIPVLEQSRAYNTIKDILRSMNEPSDEDVIQSLQNQISIFRTVTKDTKDFKPEHLTYARFKAVFDRYQEYKRLNKCIDFDDMMIICKKILDSNTSVLEGYQKKYKYILVDEFQDTNEIQLEIIKSLSKPDNNLCVVGDDDQSIYGFRGSMPDCLINFKNDFNPCETVILDTNYRSTSEIMDFSKLVISNNIKRMEKDLKSYRGKGDVPQEVYPPDENAEAIFIADSVEDLKKQGYSYKDFAVLYRVNIQSRHIIDELVKRNIPFNVKDSLNNFFDHWVCRDLTCYLKLSLNNTDTSGLLQIINRPVRYIDRASMDGAASALMSGKEDVIGTFEKTGLKEYQMQRIRELFNNLKSLKYMSSPSAVNFIRKVIGYDEYVRKYCMESNIQFDELNDILDEYEMSASGYNTIPHFLSHIHEVSIKLKDNKKITGYKRDSMTLTTVHSAKGLEFPCVFIVGASEGFFPHKKSTETGEDVEEERRIFYVAATRAKDKLFILSPKRHHGKVANISRFLIEARGDNEQDKVTGHFNVNELVSHRIFGTGKVVKINRGIVEIKFINTALTKQLDLKTCIENKLIEKAVD